MIPVIDLSPVYDNKPEAFKEVGDAIDKAAREVGFFYIKGHSISKDRINELKTLSQQFFAQPMEEKNKVAMSDTSPRGYGDAAREQLDARKPFDNKETWNMGYDLEADDPEIEAKVPLRSLNNWPELPGFKSFFKSHFNDMQQLAKLLLKLVTPHLGVPDNHFDGCFDRPLSVLRIIHYPATESKSITAGAHTDYGCVTLLYQDQVGGLQVMNKNGEWMDATPIEDTFVVNIGDMLARWSNDRYKSTQHRVLSTPNVERHSYPFFCEPDPSTSLECLPACQGEGNPAKYPTITASEHLLERFRATYADFKG